MNASDALEYLLSLDSSDFFSEFSLSDNKLVDYQKLLANFKSKNGSISKTTDKGTALESLVTFLAENTNLFEVIPNVRTSTNEIDTLLRTKVQVKPILAKYLSITTDILFECKNYNEKIGVTWVGKFHSLLRNQSCKFGIIFSYKGFTGKSWKDAVGLAKKIYLKDEIIILDFNYQDFENLESGRNFLEIIKDKIDTLKHDTMHDINTYLTEHEAEKILSSK